MPFKLRLGKWLIINTENVSEQTLESEIEKSIGSFEDEIESRLKNWIRNDRIFDFLRGTAARVILILVTWATLYGFGYLAYTNPSLTWWYVGALVLLGLIHAMSVRYVFGSMEDRGFQFRVMNVEMDGLTDEYQRARRDRAFRIAYQNIGGLSSFLIGAYVTYQIYLSSEAAGKFQIPAGFTFDFYVSLEQAIVVLAGMIGFFTLQKYIGWGFRGEPKREKEDLDKKLG